jgi:hypothetical protein
LVKSIGCFTKSPLFQGSVYGFRFQIQVVAEVLLSI